MRSAISATPPRTRLRSIPSAETRLRMPRLRAMRASTRLPDSIITLASGLEAPAKLVLSGQYLYWVDLDQETLMRLPTKGGTPVQVTSSVSMVFDVVADSKHIYWTSMSYKPKIYRVPKSGGTPSAVHTSYDSPRGLAVDGTHIYWCNYSKNRIDRIKPDGTGLAVVAKSSAWPFHIALSTSHVYWIVPGNPLLTGKVMRAAKTGGAAGLLVQLTKLKKGLGHGVVVDATHVYYINRDNGSINRVPMLGGISQVLTSGHPNPARPAVDSKHLYWIDSTMGTVMRVSKSGTPGGAKPEVVASGLVAPVAVALDGAYVYWVDLGSKYLPGTGKGTIQKRLK